MVTSLLHAESRDKPRGNGGYGTANNTRPPKVRLTGGPRDGEEWERPRPGEELIVTLWEAGPSRPSGYATYVPSSEDPSIYIFTKSQDYGWETADMPSRRPAQLRVYQLAKECGIESQVLMSRMRPT